MNKVQNGGSLEPKLLLDSSLIVATSISKYDLKIVDCGDYTQVYAFENSHTKKAKKDDLDLVKKENINLPKYDNKNKPKVIEKKNIMRSKLECQRLAKANMNEWKSFITLTIAENIMDIAEANKKLHSYITQIQRAKKDFKYICVPEFQKRGAVHYHLLTNLEVGSNFIPKRPIKKLYNKDTHSWKELEYYDIKHWNHGYSSAEVIEGDPKKVVGYISKYMTKDIDNRLFNRHRYFYSKNLNKPCVSYVDLDTEKHVDFFNKKIQDKDLIFEREYVNSYNNEKVQFLEFLTHSNCTKIELERQEKGEEIIT